MRALVTGASRGIGRSVASALITSGAQVALAVRDPESVAPLLAASPGSLALAADLRDSLATERLIERAIAALGGLDVLVNCAGVVHYTPLGSVSRVELMEQLELNFVAPFVLAQCAALHMRSGGGGAIVNVASTLGRKPAKDTAAYAATKAALISLTRSLALEFGADGVRVNAVAPGVIDTDMIRVPQPLNVRGESPSGATLPNAALDAQLAALADLHLLRRLGTPDEVAEAVMYLIGARFVTGTVLVVDGGLLLAE